MNSPPFSPSLLNKERESTNIQCIKPPLCIAERRTAGEYIRILELDINFEYMNKINSYFYMKHIQIKE